MQSNNQIETELKYMEVIKVELIGWSMQVNNYNDSIVFALPLTVKYYPELLKTKAAATLFQWLAGRDLKSKGMTEETCFKLIHSLIEVPFL